MIVETLELSFRMSNRLTRRLMKKKIMCLVPACLIVVPLLLVSCTTESTSQPAHAPPADVPSLSSQDVISIAQEHSVTSPLNLQEKRAGLCVSRGGTQGWIADYTGNGKWIVELLVRNEDESLTVYRWTVVEANLAALFLGAYTGSLIEFKLKYGYYPK